MINQKQPTTSPSATVSFPNLAHSRIHNGHYYMCFLLVDASLKLHKWTGFKQNEPQLLYLRYGL